MKSSVLIVDDEENLRKLLARIVELEGYSVLQATSLKEAKVVLEREPCQVVITDVRLPDGNGVDFTAWIKKEHASTEVIVLTAYGTIEDGVRAMKHGAFDYLTKGQHQEQIIPLLSKASEKAVLQQRLLSLEARLQKKYGFENVLGSTPKIRECIDLARKVAATDTTVLLQGETGTGKEVFAQAIHHESARRNKPFVAVNCGAFPKELMESELFGHAEGAFTGATRFQKGFLEEANEGTLFLDELGELNIDLQAKLLRVLESGEYYRVGDSRVRRVNVRIIAASNRNLEKESDEGQFRKDLYYRISVFTISLPSLRERPADIELLARFFVRHFSAKVNKREPIVPASFIKTLEHHSWKGNIRELKNVIERCVILADERLDESVLPPDFTRTGGDDSLSLADVEKAHIQKVLKLTSSNKTQAAKLLGIGLTTLYQKIKDYNL